MCVRAKSSAKGILRLAGIPVCLECVDHECSRGAKRGVGETGNMDRSVPSRVARE